MNILQRIKLRYFKTWAASPFSKGDRTRPAYSLFIHPEKDPSLYTAAPYFRVTGQVHDAFTVARIEHGKEEVQELLGFDAALDAREFSVIRAEKLWVAHNNTLSGSYEQYGSVIDYIIGHQLRWRKIKPILMLPWVWFNRLRPYPKVTVETVLNYAIARRISGTYGDGGTTFSELELTMALCPWAHHKATRTGNSRVYDRSFNHMIELILESLLSEGILEKTKVGGHSYDGFRLKRLPLHLPEYASLRVPKNWSGDRAMRTGRTEPLPLGHDTSRTGTLVGSVNVNLFPTMGLVTAILAVAAVVIAKVF